MADRPDTWPEPSSAASSSALTPVRPIGGRAAPRFGVAHEFDVARRPGVDPGSPPMNTRRLSPVPVAVPEGMWTRLRTWWACREVHPSDRWHRMKCHHGRHQIEGGRQIQLGGRFVSTERCCVWCGHKLL